MGILEFRRRLWKRIANNLVFSYFSVFVFYANVSLSYWMAQKNLIYGKSIKKIKNKIKFSGTITQEKPTFPGMVLGLPTW
jgi:hypothetical protein